MGRRPDTRFVALRDALLAYPDFIVVIGGGGDGVTVQINRREILLGSNYSTMLTALGVVLPASARGVLSMMNYQRQAMFADEDTGLEPMFRGTGFAGLAGIGDDEMVTTSSGVPWKLVGAVAGGTALVAILLGFFLGRSKTKLSGAAPRYSVPFAIDWIRRHTSEYGSIRNAARRFAIRYESHMDKIMDEIGSYPSSEPELRALQEFG